MCCFCGTFSLAVAQSDDAPIRCGTDELHEQMLEDPEYAAQFLEKKQAIRAYLTEHLDDEYRMDCDEIIYIPVAVHYQLEIPQACAIQKALDQVRTLNEDFAGTNPDIDLWDELRPTIWPAIQNKQSCIEFCLATLNHPDGFGIAEGDYAVTIEQTTGSNSAEWAGYLNFFVQDITNPLGFSPLGGNGNGDGVTIGATYFSTVSCGGINISGQYGLGRTATHEIGHYLLLEHPWGNDCTADGDGIADTPLTDESTFGCPYDPNNTDANSIIRCTAPELWPTYMEYCDDPCLFMFSAGQVDVMEAYVNTSLGNLTGNAVTTCQDALCVGFTASIDANNESCAGNDGSISIDLEGGTNPFIFSIDGGANFQEGAVFNNLFAGDFEILIRDGNDCEIEDEITLTRQTPPMSIVSSENAFCGDNSGEVTVAIDYIDDFEYSITGTPGWRESPTFAGLFPGTYTVTARNATDCTNSVSVTIADETDLQFIVRQQLPVNCPLFDNGIISLDLNTGSPPFQYTLDGENPQDNGRFENLGQGVYTIAVQDDRGCRQEREFTVSVSFLEIADECPCDVFIPNAMTPNADGLNDLLEVVPSCPISDYRLKVYDRWGGLVFESDDIRDRWNGGQNQYYVRDDIYFYKLTYRWGEERNESLEVQQKSGYVQVLR
ncbi:MAG: gliding motility-associated C-terminal domain-containing protein [Flavobacteriales bacterium]|nr:gliding motility-associated C-terminal domain-containing protein [Flavobacteriales bacterium]